MKIKQNLVIEAFERLTKTTSNKFWGFISILHSLDKSIRYVKSGITYKLDTSTLSNLLQKQFYYGTFKPSFSQNTLYITLSRYWKETLVEQLIKDKPSILDVAIFFYKDDFFNNTINENELIEKLITEIKIEKSTLEDCFSWNNTSLNLELEEEYDRVSIFNYVQKNMSFRPKYKTLSFEHPFSLASHPSELQRAPFTQTLYSGTKIQELLLLTKFNFHDYYYVDSKLTPNTKVQPPTNKIYYGAPGTGKSYTVKKELEELGTPEAQQERITFHPEYDNVSFVGGYMPITEGDSIKYKFVPQVFTNIYVKAWQNPNKPYYLVIEEINRGNCAEIFGEMFQLLDRTGGYKITPSQSLGLYLKETLGEDHEGIKDGKMNLPPNLHLWATMNTSDQSLFPMDSAFKRRWTWKYIPINESKDVEKNPSAAFFVRLDHTETFNWLDFIIAVNNMIRSNENLGADKCIGNYFIKPEENEISLEEFINKAIFYLWEDVFKEETKTPFEENDSFESFFPEATNGKEKVKSMLKHPKINIDTTPTETT